MLRNIESKRLFRLIFQKGSKISKNHSVQILRNDISSYRLFSSINDKNNDEDEDKDKKTFLSQKLESIKKFYQKYEPKISKMKDFMDHNLIFVIIACGFIIFLLTDKTKTITYDELMRIVKKGDFSNLWITEKTNDKICVKTTCLIETDKGVFFCEVLDQEILLKYAQQSLKKNAKIEKKQVQVNFYQELSSEEKLKSLSGFFTFVGLIFLFVLPKLLGKGNNQNMMMNLENTMKSKIKKFNKDDKIKVRFKNVAGMDSTRLEIEEFVDFLKNPQKYQEVGAKLPKGALLSGPPGTGKTLLAKAVAGEAGVPFYFASGSEFVEMYVGLGASRVRDLFKTAKESEAAIIFIDEIDAIGKKRAGKLSGNAESDATLNQLLVEMDGFGTKNNIIVFAATNRKDLLDPALTRPGRFDRTIDINLPDISARVEIFLIHLKPLKLADETKREKYARRLAALTPGFSGADISNICNESAIHAVRNNRTTVEDIDFEMAVERVIGGVPTHKGISEEERKVVAVHESGHGVVSWFLKGAAPLLKLTIIPRSKGALGFAQYLPNEIPLESEEDLKNKIVSILGGRAAEKEFFGRMTTGAYDDLQKAYRIAHAIVTKLGMSKSMGQGVYENNEYGIKNYSSSKNKEIDLEIERILRECTKISEDMVKEHRDKIQKMSDVLLEKETIDLKIIQKILGERPFEPESTFKAYLEENQ